MIHAGARATLTFHAYCGMGIPIDGTAFRADVGDLRRQAARRIRAARRRGRPISIETPGTSWEFGCADGDGMVSDHEGHLVLSVPRTGMADDEADGDSEDACDDTDETGE